MCVCVYLFFSPTMSLPADVRYVACNQYFKHVTIIKKWDVERVTDSNFDMLQIVHNSVIDFSLYLTYLRNIN